MGAQVQRTKDTDMLITHYGRRWRDLNAFYDPDAIAEKLIDHLRWAQKTVEPPTGRGSARK